MSQWTGSPNQGVTPALVLFIGHSQQRDPDPEEWEREAKTSTPRWCSATRSADRQAGEFVVDLWEESGTFHVNLEKLLGWLDRGRRGHKNTPRKEQLRRLL